MQPYILFDFAKNNNKANWSIVDDVVMGGKSSGCFYVNTDGHGVFEGKVSLENNGGFSSLRYRFKKLSTKPYSKVLLRIKGDGKKYQFRIKAKSSDYYSYIHSFDSSGDWESVEIALNDMYPAFRGRKLEIPNYSSTCIEEIAFLIGNKTPEDFKLIIDKLTLE